LKTKIITPTAQTNVIKPQAIWANDASATGFLCLPKNITFLLNAAQENNVQKAENTRIAIVELAKPLTA
jgi:hypothetical protein